MNLEQKIKNIEERNRRVEKDKMWKVTKVCIMILTYIISLKFIRKIWKSKINKN